MRYFLKTVLEKDQRVLLKLKSKEMISSADEKKRNPDEVKKKLKKGLLLERYVENLQKKTLNPEDKRLFKVLG